MEDRRSDVAIAAMAVLEVAPKLGVVVADKISTAVVQALDGVIGDANTLRGFIREHHMTPSMVAALMMHWQRRAVEAEEALRWARPRLSKDIYREQLDKKVSLWPSPDLDEPRLVQSGD